MKDNLNIPFGYLLPDFKLSDQKRKKIKACLPNISDDAFQTFVEHIEADICRYKGKLEWAKTNKNKTEKAWNKTRVDDFMKHARGLLDWLDAESDAASDMVLGAGLLLRHNEEAGRIETDKQKLRSALRLALNKAEIAKKVVDGVVSQGMDSTGSDARRDLIWHLAESYKVATGKNPNFSKRGFFGIYQLIDDEIGLNAGYSSLRNDVDQLRKFLQEHFQN